MSSKLKKKLAKQKRAHQKVLKRVGKLSDLLQSSNLALRQSTMEKTVWALRVLNPEGGFMGVVNGRKVGYIRLQGNKWVLYPTDIFSEPLYTTSNTDDFVTHIKTLMLLKTI